MADIVTQESDPDLYASLLAEWEREKRPGWIVTAKKMYHVVQNTDKEIEFRYVENRDYYESTGL